MNPGEETETQSGTRLARRRLLAYSAGLGVGTAGCLGGLLGDDETTTTQTTTETGLPSFEPVDLVTVVPAGVTALAALNTSALDRTGYERLLSEVERIETGDIDIAPTVRLIETRTQIDLSETEELLCHGVVTDERSLVPETALLDMRRSLQEFIAGLEERFGTDYSVTAYENEPVLFEASATPTVTTVQAGTTVPETRSTETDSSRTPTEDPVTVGILGEEQVAVGRRDGVMASLAIRFGDAEALAGPVRTAFDVVRGAHLAVVSVPTGSLVPEQYQGFVPEINPSDIETIARSYDLRTDGEGVTVRVRVATTDATTAEDVATAVRGLIGLLRETADEQARAALETVDISRDGRIVELNYKGPTEHLAVLFEGI